MNMFEFDRCSKNDVRVRSMFDKMVFDTSLLKNYLRFLFLGSFNVCFGFQRFHQGSKSYTSQAETCKDKIGTYPSVNTKQMSSLKSIAYQKTHTNSMIYWKGPSHSFASTDMNCFIWIENKSNAPINVKMTYIQLNLLLYAYFHLNDELNTSNTKQLIIYFTQTSNILRDIKTLSGISPWSKPW